MRERLFPYTRLALSASTTLVATLTLSIGCEWSLDHAPLPAPDRSEFEEHVQPVLQARCSNPTSCHALETRPFALYARRANRLDPVDIHRDPPLTEEEIEANYHRTRSFAVDQGGGPLLLTKPLDERHSGVRHEGGVQFQAPDDREFRILAQWVGWSVD